MDKENIKNDLEHKSQLVTMETPKITKINFEKLGEYKDALDYNFNITNKKIDEDEDSFKLIQHIFIFSLEENRPFLAEFEAECKFKIEKDTPKNIKETFINYSAPSYILSYLRPVFSQILIYSGLPDFRIPLVNMFDIVNEKR